VSVLPKAIRRCLMMWAMRASSDTPTRVVERGRRRVSPPPRHPAAASPRRRVTPLPRLPAATSYRRHVIPPPRLSAAASPRRRVTPPPRHPAVASPPPRLPAAASHRRLGDFRDGQRTMYRLQYIPEEGRQDIKVENVFPAGQVCTGTVLGHSDLGVHVLLSHDVGADQMQVDGLISYHRLTRAYRNNPQSAMPRGSTMEVRILEVDSGRRSIGLEPIFK
jgi:hypothetical protein